MSLVQERSSWAALRPCFPPDFEFSENCGLNDSGDHMSLPFKECPFGQCNPDSAELCSPCGGGATASAPAGSRSGTQQRCPQVLVRLLQLAGGGVGAGGVVWIKGEGVAPLKRIGGGA